VCASAKFFATISDSWWQDLNLGTLKNWDLNFNQVCLLESHLLTHQIFLMKFFESSSRKWWSRKKNLRWFSSIELPTRFRRWLIWQFGQCHATGTHFSLCVWSRKNFLVCWLYRRFFDVQHPILWCSCQAEGHLSHLLHRREESVDKVRQAIFLFSSITLLFTDFV